MGRKITALFLALVLGATMIPAAYGSTNNVRVAKFWIGKAEYEVNGVKQSMDVAPYRDPASGRTMMPIRYLAYSLGVKEKDIDWQPIAQAMNIDRYDKSGHYDTVFFDIGEKLISANGYDAGMDVAPVIVHDRTFVPYRAAAQALGGMVFWNENNQEITMVTWEDVPAPAKQTVKKVTVDLNSKDAQLNLVNGAIRMESFGEPVFITDPRDGGGMINAKEWAKLWGIPEENILVDSERGGMIVRGAAGLYSERTKGAAFVYLYANEIGGWDSGFNQTSHASSEIPNYIYNREIYAGTTVVNLPVYLFGKDGTGQFKKEAWMELN